MDRDSGGVFGIARRTVRSAKKEIASGDMGGEAVGVAVGVVFGGAVAGYAGMDR
jgi:hypothetical protein